MHLTEILLAARCRLIFIALEIAAVMNPYCRQELVSELVHSCTADAFANGLDHRGPTYA